MKKKKVVIFGAGLSGLSCAYELARNGQKVVIIEKNPYVGGMAHTFKVGDFSFDNGPHRWFTKNEEIDKWFKKLMGQELLKVPRLTHIYFKGKYFLYPIKVSNALLNIGPMKATQAVLDFLIAKIAQKISSQTPLTMEEAYVTQFGRTLYRIFFEGYNRKLWGLPANKLSGDWVIQRSRGLSIMTLVQDALLPSKGKVVSLVDEFVFPKSGIGQATEKLREKVEKLGGEVFLKSEVETLLTSDKKVKSVIIKSSGRKKEIRADEFVSSMPIDELVIKFIPKAKKDVLTKAGKLKYRDEIFVAIFVKKDRVTPDNWIYVQDPKIGFVRFQEMGNFSPFLSPKGTTSLVFEFPCNKDDATWQKSDKEMINWAIKDFTKEFGLITNKNILSGFVYRQEKTYPTYTLDYQSLLKVVKEFVYSFSNLQIIGRSGMFRYNNMDHSVATGLYAARNIIAGKKIYDIEAVNLEKEYHEEKRVKEA